jgi:IclR family acetate operon transcriptional repressor
MNNTLQNGFRILEFMANTGETYSVKELAELFDLPNSHVCRLLKTLVETGYLEQDRSRKYRVSVQILCLANACLSRLIVRDKAKPYLYKLHREMNQNVYLVVNHKGRALIVDVITASSDGSEVSMTIGKLNQVNTTACGKLCGAYIEPELKKDLFADMCREKRTENTIISEKALEKEFSKILDTGYSVTDSEQAIGTFAVAAPVFNCNGRMCAGVGTFTNNPELDFAEKKKMIEQTRQCAESVSFALGYLSENM